MEIRGVRLEGVVHDQDLEIIDGVIRLDDLLKTAGWSTPKSSEFWRSEIQARKQERDQWFAQATAEAARLRQQLRATKEELAQAYRLIASIRDAADEATTALRAQLVAALGVEDDTLTPLAVYVEMLAGLAQVMQETIDS